MISQIIITVETDKKDTTINIVSTSYVRKYGSNKHKEAVGLLKKRVDKLIEQFTG